MSLIRLEDIKTQYDSYRRNMFAKTDWWIGVEHEFFLLKNDDTPPERDDVIRYFHLLAKVGKYNVTPSQDGGVSRISKETSTGYSNIKYDQEPCLLEFSTSKHDSIASLHKELTETFDLLEYCSKELNLKTQHSPLLNIAPGDHRLLSPIPRWQLLRKFRQDCAAKHGRTISEAVANYGIVIAATQIQISGKHLDWLNQPHLISALYKLEPHLIKRNNPDADLVKRWKYYFEIFEGYPLIGAPLWDDWTIENWIKALNNSPFFEDPYVSSKISSTSWVASVELYIALKKVRDFQSIRPKIYSALEFRSDGARRSAQEVTELALTHFKACQFVVENDIDGNYLTAAKECNELYKSIYASPRKTEASTKLLALIDAERVRK